MKNEISEKPYNQNHQKMTLIYRKQQMNVISKKLTLNELGALHLSQKEGTQINIESLITNSGTLEEIWLIKT